MNFFTIILALAAAASPVISSPVQGTAWNATADDSISNISEGSKNTTVLGDLHALDANDDDCRVNTKIISNKVRIAPGIMGLSRMYQIQFSDTRYKDQDITELYCSEFPRKTACACLHAGKVCKFDGTGKNVVWIDEVRGIAGKNCANCSARKFRENMMKESGCGTG